MKCGLLGRKLGHSYSPQIHAMLGDYTYDLFETDPDDVESFLHKGDFTGINVTIPYKQTVIPFLNELSPAAQKLGAVNTIVRRNGRLIGHNTDYFGFQWMLTLSGLNVSGKKVLVLGAGGASRPIREVLIQAGANVVMISRSGQNSYHNLHQHHDAAAIVNTTPVGMYPDNGNSPIDLDLFPHLEGVLDIIFNPARTALLLEAEKRGLITAGGLSMLVAQAKEASEWFAQKTICDDIIQTILSRLSRQMQNIVLIGMPGCGKSTIGSLLAEKTGRVFSDADTNIVQAAGKPIPRIFAEEQETGFRKWETGVLDDLGKQSGLVIATGGGCVTQPGNYPLLRQNSRIVWIQRNLDDLPTDGRPLSKSHSITDLYAERAPLYAAFADITVANNGTVDETVSAILSKLEELS